MEIWPAIDIINQQPVRLYQGDYNQKEVVGESILKIAKTFEKAGAKHLHLVDLDGAKEGHSINEEVIIEVCKQTSMQVEIGGGIRTKQQIIRYLENGISRVILGTVAVENLDFVKEMNDLYPGQIVVGMDIRDGYVKTSGWLTDSKIHYTDFIKDLENIGIQTVIVTDISKDGTLEGPNVSLYQDLKQRTSMQIIASGGVSQISDIDALNQYHVDGVISGKAIYHNTLSLDELLGYEE